MRFTTLLMLLLSAVFVLDHPVRAADETAGIQFECFAPEGPAVHLSETDSAKRYLDAWLASCAVKIAYTGMKFEPINSVQTASDLSAIHRYKLPLAVRVIRDHDFKKPVSCSFKLSKDGSARNFCIIRTSGSDLIDAKAIELVQKAAPFCGPPSDIPFKQGLTALFTDHPSKPVQVILSDRTVLTK